MGDRKSYTNIDMIKTGKLLKRLFVSKNYTVKEVQEYLHLSCPQPIYRWFKGIILPSVDHLFMLSELFDVHMEELLVKKNTIPVEHDIECCYLSSIQKRVITYYNKIYKSVA